jgi:hypothetical protein
MKTRKRGDLMPILQLLGILVNLIFKAIRQYKKSQKAQD